MRWSQRQVSLLWLPDRLHVALCHAAKPHHLRGHHWQHLPALAGEHFDSIFLFRRNVCVLLLLLLLTNTLIHLPFHRRNVGRRQTACSTTPTCEFLARHQFQPTWWKPVCGVRNFSSRLRSYLMYTTAAIMSIGVLFDVLVVYYAKFVSNRFRFLFNFDSETLTSSRRQWWRRSRSRWRHRKIQSHCKLSPFLISFNKSLVVLLKPW